MITAGQVEQAKAWRPTFANLDTYAVVCSEVGFPWFLALTVLEKESGGKNVYGHDVGGALSGFPDEVTEANFRVFDWLRTRPGAVSNGCGPLQITYGGYFPLMAQAGLKPWIPEHNMRFGLGHILMPRFVTERKTNPDREAFRRTARAYNTGSTTPKGDDPYATDALLKADVWASKVGTHDTLVKWS